MSPLIRFDNVSKRYNLGLTRTSLPSLLSRRIRQVVRPTTVKSSKQAYLWAVKDVSFELERGQSLALIGPNGAGKSTILKLLSKITLPSSGNIEVNGRLSALIELGAGFHPDLTGRENVYLNGRILGLKRKEIDSRFDEIVDFSELEKFIDTPVKRYSSGMAVRLGFAVASCIEPDILLVDEVLAVGDASFRQKCIDRIRVLLNNDTSLIFISHNLELVKAICESGIYIEQGEVQFSGTSAAVIDKYNQVLERNRANALKRPDASITGNGADIEISRIEVSSTGDQPVTGFYNDQPLEVKVHYFANTQLDKANMLVRIYRSDGVSCLIVRTFLDGFPMSFERGYGIVTLTIDPLQLYGALYFATVWVMDADDKDGLANASSDWFQVNNRVPGRPDLDAVFEPERTWHHANVANGENPYAHDLDQPALVKPGGQITEDLR